MISIKHDGNIKERKGDKSTAADVRNGKEKRFSI